MISFWVLAYSAIALLAAWVTDYGLDRDRPNRLNRGKWTENLVIAGFGLFWPLALVASMVMALRKRPAR